MSADNGIYILESKDGFRIVHAQAIENLMWWDGCAVEGLNPKYVYDYFKYSKLIKDRGEAYIEAFDLYKELSAEGFVEYGIVPIVGWEDKEFPEKQ